MRWYILRFAVGSPVVTQAENISAAIRGSTFYSKELPVSVERL